MELACSIAEEFSNTYYSCLDKNRPQMGALYVDTGILTWNGHGHVTPDRIQSFLSSLPPTDTTIHTLDAQPIPDPLIPSQQNFLIQTTGELKFLDPDVDPNSKRAKKIVSHSFNQIFMLTMLGNKHKIVTDSFRQNLPMEN